MRFALVIVGLAFAGVAYGQSQSTDIREYGERLTGDALYDAFAGVTHDGAYNFDREGNPSGRYSEEHRTDGVADYREANRDQLGAWVLRNEGICYWYPDGGGGCFNVWRVDNCHYFYSDDLPATADGLTQDYWTARSVKRGEDATCEARFT